METKNIPLISKLRNLVTGGVSPFHTEDVYKRQMTKHITDLIQGIIQVRMFPAGRKTVDRYNEEADVYAVKSDKRNMFSSLLECANTGFDLICNLVFRCV